MLFTSIRFLPFLALSVAAFYGLPRRFRWLVLLAVSTVFYLLLDVRGILLLLATAAVTYVCALRIGALQEQQAAWKQANKQRDRAARKAGMAGFERRQKAWVVPALCCDVGLLFLLKYYGVFAGGFNTATGANVWTAANLFVPLGISYYTLQLISYLVDVYRTVIPPEKNFAKVAGYALFFLSITQGPFHRYGDFARGLENGPDCSAARLWNGARRMAWGYFQKLAVADRAAIIVSHVFDHYTAYSGLQQFACMCAFGIQLYADFAGYTNIVLGAGEMMGLTLPDNFRQPFFSRNMSEFWQRWHITLGAWLKDYVFYPVLKSAAFANLSGFLKGKMGKKAARGIPTYLGMFILWFTIGLWHGAGFNYVFGVGILQFLYIFLGEIFAPLLQRVNAALHVERIPRLWRVWQGVRCTLLMIFAWVFFRAESFGQAVGFLAHMVSSFAAKGFGLGQLTELGLNRMGLLYLAVGLAWLFVVDLLHEKGHHLRAELDVSPLWLRWPIYLAGILCMAFMGIFMSGGTSTFLYAHF